MKGGLKFKRLSITILMCLIFFVSFTVFSIPKIASAAPITQYVKDDVNLLETANKNAKIITTIKKYSTVTVLSASNGWSYVQSEEQKGYINTSALTSKKPTTITKYVQAKGDIYIRDKATSSAKKIATIPNKSAVFVYYSSNGWSYIHYNKHKGFVYTDALTSKKPSTTSTNVTGGLLPKVGLKLTYSSEFLTSGKTTYTIKKETIIKNNIISVSYTDGNGHEGYYFLEDSSGFSFGTLENNNGFENHWIIFNLYYPLVQGSTVPYIGPTEYGIANPKIVIESTTETVTVKAGTFKNVVVFKQPDGIRYYIAKGIGIIKIQYTDGTINELVSIN